MLNRLLKDQATKALRVPPVFNLYKALANSIFFPTRNSVLFIFKGLHLSAPSEVIQALYLQTHEYITTGWCSVNAKDLPMFI